MSASGSLKNRLKLRQLRLLAALDEVSSLHQAAALLGMTQPAATRLLQELEAAIDAPLFDRSRKGVQPTDIGRMLIRHATALVSGIDHVYEEAQAIKRGNAGTLRIGFFSAAFPLMLARAVLHLKRATPHIDIQIQEGPQDALVAALRNGALNVVIGRMPAEDASHGLHCDLLFKESFSVVGRVGHPMAAAAAPLGMAELIDYPWFLPLPGTPLRGSLDIHFVLQCGRMPSEIVESAAVGFNLAMLDESDYVAMMPRSIARFHAAKGMLCVLIDEVPNLYGAVTMITKGDMRSQVQVQRLAEAMRMQMDPAQHAP